MAIPSFRQVSNPEKADSGILNSVRYTLPETRVPSHKNDAGERIGTRGCMKQVPLYSLIS